MQRVFVRLMLQCGAILLMGSNVFAESVTSRSGITITAMPDGHYSVQCQNPAWSFAGDLKQAWTHLVSQPGKDDSGSYTQIQGHVSDGISATIRVYDNRPVVLFSWTSKYAAATSPLLFPSLDSFPENLHPFSYGKGPFAPPSFKLEQNGTPWILFDDAANTAILSPASNFMIASMKGSLDGSLASDFNAGVVNLPAGFTHETLLAVGQGIHATALTWGHALSEHLHAARPTNESDALLKYFGYWTDNGAAYYYNYDLAKGYAGTLADLIKRYHDEQIPLHYLQLDSWWYQKSFTDVVGKVGKSKNAKLPEGTWNRYGGTLEYRAHPFLFPDGLAAWQKSIELPLVVHGRWIDAESPYQKEYRISAIAPIDPKYWDDTAVYLHDSGVACYEQDWLNEIYDHAPALQTNSDAGNAFTDNMARATHDHGMTMQYCMAPARFFLQAAKYPNLTTIRVNQDRFERKKWQSFLDASLLAEATGRWPWVDVFMSGETDNLLLSVLSAGPVGTGDAMGKEHRDNLMKAIRADGVIVKPDVPVVRVDSSFIADANDKKRPLLATTYTNHDGLKTIYAFAFMRAGDSPELTFTPAELGATTDVYVFDRATSNGKLLKAGDAYSATLDPKGAGYFILAPVGKCGIALLGDQEKFVSTGKQRIAAMKDAADSLTASVLVVPVLEKDIVLHGFAPKKPVVIATGGSADPVAYDAASHYFSVKVHPDPMAVPSNAVDPTIRLDVRFSLN